MPAPSLNDQNHDETVSGSSSLQSQTPPPPKMIPRRNSLRLLTTTPYLNIPVPPSLKTSPYLSSSSSVFNRGLSSPTLPSEEDERWLQDTIPLLSRHHEKVAGSESDLTRAVTSKMDGVTPHQPARTPSFVPPSLVILDTGLCRRWSGSSFLSLDKLIR